ncbi:MAG: hypothetical protein KJZ56_04080 [Flavobacteriales bacterium]|nr:hypothetical protein [Flavobacteriales bacterium]
MRRSLLFLQYISVSFLLVYFTGCKEGRNTKENSQTDSLLTYFKKVHQLSLTQNHEMVFILDEEGCPTCNRTYAKELTKFINNKKVIILVRAGGSQVDISQFLGDSLSNVYLDDTKRWKNWSFLNNSKIVQLKNLKIDTVININIKNILNQVYFMETRLQRQTNLK